MRSKRLTGTITVRMKTESLRVLQDRARRMGRTSSDLIRAVVERELAGPQRGSSAYELTKDLVGSLEGVAIGPARDTRRLLAKAIVNRRG
jgi:hypothetical protein